MIYYNTIKTLIWKFVRTNHYYRHFTKNVLIILTSPRSGSTWFSDAIRCHPMIQYCPYGIIYAYLGLSGRRYPEDLSNGPDAIQKIEVLPFKWEKIPNFDPLGGYSPLTAESFLMEKCHPEFFHFDTKKIINKIKRLKSKNVRIKFIYQIRDPVASFASFMNYQERNPKWYPSIKGHNLVAYMHKTFAAINELALQEPGVIIDFSSIMIDLESVLRKAYSYIWPLHKQECFNTIINHAVTTTARHKRPQSKFLGKNTGSIRGVGNKYKYKYFFEQYKNSIQKCYDSYNSLLNITQQPGP
jgi:hypothetical protein